VPAEAGELRKLAGSLPERTRVIGVNFTDDEKGARSFARYYGWRFPNLFDPEGTAGSRYGVHALPTTFILDPRGRIAKTLYGPQTASRLRDALESAR
jgi:peroxiredoxin